jgi:hypothetical protein
VRLVYSLALRSRLFNSDRNGLGSFPFRSTNERFLEKSNVRRIRGVPTSYRGRLRRAQVLMPSGLRHEAFNRLADAKLLHNCFKDKA